MQLYNTMQNVNENTTDYLVSFRNAQKANEAFNGSLISRGFQEHEKGIIYLLHVTGFDALSDDGNKEAEEAG